MRLPPLLPKIVQWLYRIEDGQELLDQLTTNPEYLFPLLEYCLDNETWSELHLTWIHNALELVNRAFIEGALSFQNGISLAHIIQKHYKVLESAIPLNLICQTKTASYPVNSFLWQASSDSLYTLIRTLLRETPQLETAQALHFPELTTELFTWMNEFISTGKVEYLWREEPKDINKLLKVSLKHGIRGLDLFCEEILARYIDKHNPLESLLEARKNHYTFLKQAAAEYLNQDSSGAKIYFPKRNSFEELLGLHFLDFSLSALERFESLKKIITHLSFQGDLLEKREIKDILVSTPLLEGLDFSNTNTFANQFDKVRLEIRDLDLTHVVWLDDHYLKEIAQSFINVRRLSIGENHTIGPRGWSFLKNFPLQEVDLSYCTQLDDSLFEIVLHSISKIKNLSLAGCQGLGDKSFFQIALRLEDLEDLDCRKTAIREPELVEIAYRCLKLKIIVIDKHQLPLEAYENMKKSFPHVKISHN